MEKHEASRTVKSVDKKVLALLNKGEIETRNLVEGLAINFSILAKHLGVTTDNYSEKSIVKRMQYYGSKISNWEKFKDHPSDTVRGWAAYSLAQSSLSFEKKINSMAHFANDPHFGVREWAWLAIRPEMIQNLTQSIKLMEKWSKSPQSNIRRFSVESLRPRGVWCSHIDQLKNQPELFAKILNNLKSDEEKYVKDSVGNWLNDAAKTNPTWVKKLCTEWQKLKNPHTDYIIKKALRSLK